LQLLQVNSGVETIDTRLPPHQNGQFLINLKPFQARGLPMFKFVLLVSLVFTGLPALADEANPGGDTPELTVVERLIDEIGLRESDVAARDLPGWSPPTKMVVWPVNADWLPGLKSVAPGVELVVVQNREEARKAAVGAQAVIGTCDEEMLSGATDLFWIQVYSAGVERCIGNPSLQNRTRLLTNGQRIGSPGLAEHAIAMMMMLARGLDVYHTNQLSGAWKRQTQLARTDHIELEGKTLLVAGLGGIGTQAAKRGHGLGMRVIATRNSRREGPEYVDYVGLSHELSTLAAQADVVINTVPLTDQTRGMFNSAIFDAMKPRAFYINVGRGGTTDTNDLVAALKSGSIGGAGLDVTDPEPLPEGHPLWTMPRVIISPHTAGRSDNGRERLYLMVKENLRRYVNGEPMLSVVDIERGY
jgi:phosphoglycerate dehydrogenase-like enzyme